MTGLSQPSAEFARFGHRYDDEERTDGLKRLIAGRDIPSWNVSKGKRGGLVSDSSVIGGDAWVDTASTVRDSVISGALVRDSEIVASRVRGSVVIQSSIVHASFLTDTECDRAHIFRSILFWGSVIRDTSFAPKPLARAAYEELPKVHCSVLMGAKISGNSSVYHSSLNGAEIHASEISESTLGGSKAHYATVLRSSVDWSYLYRRIVREARVSRLSEDAKFGQLRFPSKETLDRSAELSGGYFGDFPAQIDIWPKLPGRLRQIAVLAWIVGVPLAIWTTPLLSIAVALPLLALVVLRLASGLASRIVGKLQARSMARQTAGRGRSRVSAVLKSCSTVFNSLKKLLNGLLLAGTVLVPTAIVIAAVVERVLNSDAEPSRSAEAVDSVSADVGSYTVVSDHLDRHASSSTASSGAAVPTPASVTSSNLGEIAYDPEYLYLHAWFQNVGLYRHNGVP